MQNLHREIMIKLQCFTKIWCKMAIIPFKILHQAPQERLIIYTVKTLKFTYKGTLSTIEKYNSQHIQFSGHSFEGLEYQVGLMNQSVGTNEHIYCPVRKNKDHVLVTFQRMPFSKYRVESGYLNILASRETGSILIYQHTMMYLKLTTGKHLCAQLFLSLLAGT